MNHSSCYMCDSPATGIEHAPARCFFPKGFRKNLITVPSCSVHNNATSKDDEYVRGIIVSSAGNNDTATSHWRNAVRKTFLHSPKLFFKTFEHQRLNSFFHDRKRIDETMIKIAYALYFIQYGKRWAYYPTPYYKQFYDDDGKSDIETRLPNYLDIPNYEHYEGANQNVFKYYFLDGKVNGNANSILKMVFYEGFEVFILPHTEKVNLPYDTKP